jgi:predicted DNA-binding transcriptional regulator YafY
MSGGVEMARSTFNRNMDAIEEMFGIYIDCDRKNGNKYYIGNAEVLKEDTIQNWMLSTLSVSNIVSESLSVQNRILLESIPSEGEHLQIVIDAMREKHLIRIDYRRYGTDEHKSHTFAPYCVKLFKQRWYLVALSPYYEKVMIYALDRIKDMEVEDEHFVYPDDFDPDSFFEGCIGVIVDEEYDIETVRLKVSAHQSNYIRSLPMHSSQKEIERNDDYSIFTFEVRPTFDFQQEILMNGADMEVLSPERLRNEIAEKIENMSNNYKK